MYKNKTKYMSDITFISSNTLKVIMDDYKLKRSSLNCNYKVLYSNIYLYIQDMYLRKIIKKCLW